MKIRFVTDFVSSSGVRRRAGDVRDYPDGMADMLIRRHKVEAVEETNTDARRLLAELRAKRGKT